MPIDPTVVSGSASFNQQGANLYVTNTPSAIINWGSFSIGSQNLVQFLQQYASSAVLNRVIGQDPSQILGSLLSNGRVFIINPNGITFGAGSTVDVAGLVASSLDMSNADFLAGNLNFAAGAVAGGVENNGTISTPTGGFVYLIAPDIQNNGIINTPQGDVILAAGSSVILADSGQPEIQVVLTAPGQAVNVGQIIAQSGRVGIYAALIDQKGVVNTNTAVAGQDGRVYLRAAQDINLDSQSLTTASGEAGGVNDGGEVRIVADGRLTVAQGAELHADGGVDGGDGGFIELSAHDMVFRGEATALAQVDVYQHGSILIDPFNIYFTTNLAAPSCGTGGNACFDPNSGALGAGTVTFLADNDIFVNTAIDNGDFNPGSPGGLLEFIAARDINVNGDIGTASTVFNHDFTLRAGNNLNINRSIYLGGSDLANNTLNLSANADSSGSGDVNISGGAAFNGVTVDTLGAINVSGVNFNVNAGSVSGSGNRDAKVIAGTTLTANMTGDMNVTGGDADGGEGGTVSASALVQSGGNMTLTLGGDLTIAAGNARARASDSGFSDATAQANAGIISGGDMTLNINSLDVAGFGFGSTSGQHVLAQAFGTGTNSATASGNATIDAGGNLTVNLSGGGVNITGGNFALASATGSNAAANNTATATASGLVMAGGSITIGSSRSVASSLFVAGGSDVRANASHSGTNDATANAQASLTADGGMTLFVSGPVNIRGGVDASASAQGGSAGARAIANVDASALISAGTTELSADGNLTITVSSGDVNILGGSNAFALATGFSALSRTSAQANANALVSAGGNLNLTVSSGNLTVQGGGSAEATASESGFNRATANANAELSAGNDMTLLVVNGSIAIRGGGSGSAEASDAFSAGTTNVATVNAIALVSAGGNLTIGSSGAAASSLTVRGGDNAFASASSGESGASNAIVSANATLHADGNMTLFLNSGMTVQGGSSASVYASYASGQYTLAINTNAAVSAGGAMNITINSGDLNIQGGNNASASSFSDSGAANININAIALLSAGGAMNLMVTSGSVDVRGGDNVFLQASSSASGNAQISARADISAGSLTIQTNTLNIVGGSSARALASASHATTVLVDVGASVSGGGVNISANNVFISGGSASATASGSSANQNVTALSNASLSGGSITFTGGSIFVSGGNALTDAPSGSNTAVANATGTLQASSLTFGSSSSFAGNSTVSGGSATGSASSAKATADATALIEVGTLNMFGGTLGISGGGATANDFGGGNAAALASALVLVSGDTNLNLTGNLDINAGSSATANGAGATATAGALLAGGEGIPLLTGIPSLMTIMVNNVSLTTGGIGGTGTAYAFAGLTNVGDINITVNGGVTIRGNFAGLNPPGTGVFPDFYPITIVDGLGMPVLPNIIDTGAGDVAFIQTLACDVCTQLPFAVVQIINETTGEINDLIGESEGEEENENEEDEDQETEKSCNS